MPPSASRRTRAFISLTLRSEIPSASPPLHPILARSFPPCLLHAIDVAGGTPRSHRPSVSTSHLCLLSSASTSPQPTSISIPRSSKIPSAFFPSDSSTKQKEGPPCCSPYRLRAPLLRMVDGGGRSGVLLPTSLGHGLEVPLYREARGAAIQGGATRSGPSSAPPSELAPPHLPFPLQSDPPSVELRYSSSSSDESSSLEEESPQY